MTSRQLSRRSKAISPCPTRTPVGGVDGQPGDRERDGDQRQRQDGNLPDGTKVPTDAIEAPASVPVPGVIAPAVPEGSADSVVSGASSNGIPAPALAAYQRGAQIINAADKSCNIPWELIAAIGRVESDHGRYGGNTLTEGGVSKPGIYGIAAERQERHPGHQRHRRRPARQGPGLRPRGRPDAVHPLDLAGRQGRRRRRRPAQPPGHGRRRARDRCLPLLRQGQPLHPLRARRRRSTATTTPRTT